jgi:hypothetical protein
MDRNVVFSGNLRFLGIPDLLQLIATNNSTGILGLTNPMRWGTASVTFLRGNPIHATYASLRGLEALYALFGWTTGQFEFRQEKLTTKKPFTGDRWRSFWTVFACWMRASSNGWDRDRKKGQPGARRTYRVLPLIKKPITHYAFSGGRGRIFKRDDNH